MYTFSEFAGLVERVTDAGRSKTSSAAEGAPSLPRNSYALVVHGQETIQALPMAPIPALAESAAFLLSDSSEELPATVRKVSAARVAACLDAMGVTGAYKDELESIADGQLPRELTWGELQLEYLKHFSSGAVKESARVTHKWSLECASGEFQVSCTQDALDADQWLHDHAHKLTSTEKRSMARNVVKALRELGVDPRGDYIFPKLSAETKAFGGDKVRPNVASLLVYRGEELRPSPELSCEVTRQKVSSVYKSSNLAASSYRTREEFDTMAERLDHLEQTLEVKGRDVHLDVFLPLGEDVGLFEKRAESLKWEVIHTSYSGVRILRCHLDALARLDLTPIEKKLGEKVAEGLRDEPVDVFNSLPAPQKEFVSQFLLDTVVFPQKNV